MIFNSIVKKCQNCDTVFFFVIPPSTLSVSRVFFQSFFEGKNWFLTQFKKMLKFDAKIKTLCSRRYTFYFWGVFSCFFGLEFSFWGNSSHLIGNCVTNEKINISNESKPLQQEPTSKKWNNSTKLTNTKLLFTSEPLMG